MEVKIILTMKKDDVLKTIKEHDIKNVDEMTGYMKLKLAEWREDYKDAYGKIDFQIDDEPKITKNVKTVKRKDGCRCDLVNMLQNIINDDTSRISALLDQNGELRKQIDDLEKKLTKTCCKDKMCCGKVAALEAENDKLGKIIELHEATERLRQEVKNSKVISDLKVGVSWK